jgi:poly-gamma-glutamate synthesis protein (capsule biosynthesis protein)
MSDEFIPAGDAVTAPELEFNNGAKIDPKELIIVAAVGDVLLHAPLQALAAKRNGYSFLFASTINLIKGAHVSFANLEGPAARGVTRDGKDAPDPPTIFDGKIYSGYPRFNYKPIIANELKRTGFSVVNTGNNHALDRGKLGVNRTINSLRSENLLLTGSRSSAAMNTPWHCVTSLTVNGNPYSIAWLGCTFITNRPDPLHQILNCYSDKAEIKSTISSLSQDTAIHAVIVTPHWGVEDQSAPRHKQVVWAQEMVDAGATAIVGQHPHVIQPIEKMTSHDGLDVPVVYSLGNYVSGQTTIPRRSSIILILGLMRSKGGKLITARLGWIPIWMVQQSGYFAEPTATSTDPQAKQYQDHLTSILPLGNILPPTVPYWSNSGSLV